MNQIEKYLVRKTLSLSLQLEQLQKDFDDLLSALTPKSKPKFIPTAKGVIVIGKEVKKKNAKNSTNKSKANTAKKAKGHSN